MTEIVVAPKIELSSYYRRLRGYEARMPLKLDGTGPTGLFATIQDQALRDEAYVSHQGEIWLASFSDS